MKSVAVILLIILSINVNAQDGVNHLAPFAQKLVEDLKTSHKELLFIGLHVTPPIADTNNIIIASTALGKIGKVSSPGDMEVINKEVLRLKTKKADKIYEICLPIGTASGSPLGMVVIQIEFKDAKNIVDALEKGLQIRDDLQKQIANKEILFSKNES